MHRRADRTRVLRQWFQDPSAPDHFAHHALLPGADSRLFVALERDLRLRLYSGRARRAGVTRAGSFRQGSPAKFAAWLCGVGCIGLISIGLAASPLGRDSRQFARQGGVVRAALLAPDLQALRSPSAILFCAALIATGVLVGAGPRKHMWLVAHPVASGRIDVWIAGDASRDSESFAREFTSFVRRATHMARDFEQRDAPTRGAAPSRSARRHRGAARARAIVRGTGSAART